MKVSGFTFLRNGEMLGYPFIQSIVSALPICDEFIVNIGPCEDNTIEMVRAIGDPKIKIIENAWNEQMRVGGYVYGQQKTIAHYNCTGDWAFYLEADEVLHEDDLSKIYNSMERNLDDERIEALIFDYLHFYGNHNTYAWSPAWYWRAPRIIRNTVRSYSPDGLFFVVLDGNKTGRYPRAAHTDATIYHYGWVRSEEQMYKKFGMVCKYWSGVNFEQIDYTQIDQAVLREFVGTHPAVMSDWLPQSKPGLFKADPEYKLTRREKKHRLIIILEKIFNFKYTNKHYRLVK